jgi:protein PhnA
MPILPELTSRYFFVMNNLPCAPLNKRPMSSPLSEKLKQRSESICELCTIEKATTAFAVSPKNNDTVENEVALCDTCLKELDTKDSPDHWRCLAGSIWNTEPSVQALSYRILYAYRDKEWAAEIINSADLPEFVVNWALSAYQEKEIHKDANGVELINGDNVILIQVLNVKGANFMAPKGTMVRKIRLVPDNHEQIEGKINGQTIVILTKFVRKS